MTEYGQVCSVDGAHRTGYSAHVPDLPGCVAMGHTVDETKMRMQKALAAAMREDGDEIPKPSHVELLEVV